MAPVDNGKGIRFVEEAEKEELFSLTQTKSYHNISLLFFLFLTTDFFFFRHIIVGCLSKEHVSILIIFGGWGGVGVSFTQ